MTDTTKDRLKEIKQSFRLLMNGVTAQSQREKGLDYHINWGASLQHLRELASEYEADKDLAMALWKDDVRECKIIATILMPPEAMEMDMALLWIEQTHTQEIAEIATTNLYQHLSYAEEMALLLIASPDVMKQLHGYALMSCLFAKGTIPNERDINEFIDQAISALCSENIALKHKAMNAIQHFAEHDDTCHKIAKGALKTIKMDDWLG